MGSGRSSGGRSGSPQ